MMIVENIPSVVFKAQKWEPISKAYIELKKRIFRERGSGSRRGCGSWVWLGIWKKVCG
jgi:hypothetical protein